TATHDLSAFHLDLAGMEVESVAVDGETATFTREGDELIVTPAEPIPAAHSMAIEVRYSGIPQPVRDGALGEEIGWLISEAGDSFVASEPDGAKSFLASNDHPSDKATFTFRIRTNPGEVGAANGRLVDRREE